MLTIKDIENIDDFVLTIKDIENIDDFVLTIKDIENIDDFVLTIKDIENIDDFVLTIKDIENIDDFVLTIKDIENIDDSVLIIMDIEQEMVSSENFFQFISKILFYRGYYFLEYFILFVRLNDSEEKWINLLFNLFTPKYHISIRFQMDQLLLTFRSNMTLNNYKIICQNIVK